MLVLVLDIYSAVEYNEDSKPIAAFYDFNDSYDVHAFDKAKDDWINGLVRGKKYSIDEKSSTSFARNNVYEAKIINGTTIKLIELWTTLKI